MNHSTSVGQPSDGRAASNGPDEGYVALGKEVVSEITDDDVPGLAAEVAYHAIFSIPALLVVLVTLAAVIDNTTNANVAERLRTMISENAPESTQDILEALVDNAVDKVDGGLASIGLVSALLVALWAGSNGVAALMKAFNRAYDIEEVRSFPRKKGASVLLTIALGIVVNLAIALWVFGGAIGSWLAGEFSMGSTFDWVWNLSRFPVGVLVIVFMLAILYYFGPTAEQEFRWVLPGAVFSTVAWGVLVFGFSFYLRFANPGSAYGALGGVIVFLFFLYLTALIFIVGAELNAVLARRHDERYQESIEDELARDEQVIVREVEQEQRVAPAASRNGSMAIGAAALTGIVIAALLRRRGS